MSALNRLNPIGKIAFVILELILLFAIKDKTVILSILVILAIIFLLNPKLLKYSISAVLNLSPLFFAIFLLGYISGTTWQGDSILIGKIAILICFSTILIHTTSAFAFLKNIRGILSQKFFDDFIIYIYGIINFFPILYQQFFGTMIAYKLQKDEKIRISTLPQLFTCLVEKSLYQVKTLNLATNSFAKSKFTLNFVLYDAAILLIVIFQFSLL